MLFHFTRHHYLSQLSITPPTFSAKSFRIEFSSSKRLLPIADKYKYGLITIVARKSFPSPPMKNRSVACPACLDGFSFMFRFDQKRAREKRLSLPFCLGRWFVNKYPPVLISRRLSPSQLLRSCCIATLILVHRLDEERSLRLLHHSDLQRMARQRFSHPSGDQSSQSSPATHASTRAERMHNRTIVFLESKEIRSGILTLTYFVSSLLHCARLHSIPRFPVSIFLSCTPSRFP